MKRNKHVATDTIYGVIPAVDTNGQTQAKIFIGRKTLVSSMYEIDLICFAFLACGRFVYVA